MSKWLLIAVATVATSGFGADSITKPRIIDGTQVSPLDYPNVALILAQDSSVTIKGSGVLITPRHVLTAGHVVAAASGKATTVYLAGNAYSVATMVQHPSFLLNPSKKPVDTVFDLGIMTLSEDVVGINPVTILSTGPTVGQVVQIVGYGDTRTSDNFTAPIGLYSGVTTYEQITIANALWHFKAGQSNTGEGDSGGPAFVVLPDGTRYLSTTTQGGETAETVFGNINWNARLDTEIPWMELVTGVPLSIIDMLTPATQTGSLNVNLTKSNSDTITLSVTSPDLVGADLPFSQTATVQIGTYIDSLSTVEKTGKSSTGRIAVNTKTGQLKYQAHKASLLAGLQAENISTSTGGTDPVFILVRFNNKLYGGTVNANVTVKSGKLFKAKF